MHTLCPQNYNCLSFAHIIILFSFPILFQVVEHCRYFVHCEMQNLKADIARHSIHALMEQPEFGSAFRQLASGTKQMQQELQMLQQSITKKDDEK